MKKLSVFSVMSMLAFFAACSDSDFSKNDPVGPGETEQSGNSSMVEDGSSSSVSEALSSSSIVPDEGQIGSSAAFGELIDSRDGHVYKTVEIGDQVWMAENLQYKGKSVFGYEEVMDAEVSGCYEENLIWGEDFGMWTPCPVKQPVQGICPDGWHLPTHDEWMQLIAYVNGAPYTADFVPDENSGFALKTSSGWGEGFNGSDAFGFGALPTDLFYWAGTAGDAEWFSSDYFTIRGNKADVVTMEVVDASVRCLKGEGSHEPVSWIVLDEAR